MHERGIRLMLWVSPMVRTVCGRGLLPGDRVIGPDKLPGDRPHRPGRCRGLRGTSRERARERRRRPQGGSRRRGRPRAPRARRRKRRRRCTTRIRPCSRESVRACGHRSARTRHPDLVPSRFHRRAAPRDGLLVGRSAGHLGRPASSAVLQRPDRRACGILDLGIGHRRVPEPDPDRRRLHALGTARGDLARCSRWAATARTRGRGCSGRRR